ncbi:serine protease 33-like isoform X2 [Oculina patagonica]
MFVTYSALFLLICWTEVSQSRVKQPKDEITDILDFFKEYKLRNKREACEDRYHNCKPYKPYCKHEDYKKWVKNNCKKTCDLCPKECLDRVSYCKVIKKRCRDKIIGKSMRYYCAKTCGVCEVIPPTLPTLPPTTIPRTEQPIDQGSVECGTKAVHSRIVGGTNAKPGSWPWQVTMDYTDHHAPHWCGGSIVTPHWIVTAAHCFAYGVDPKKYTIVVGEHDLNGIEGYEQNMTIDRIIKHPDYKASQNHDYDVALLKLKNPIKYNSHVRPVCLAKTDFDIGTNCSVTGWGHTSEGGDIPEILQQAQVPLVSRDTCQRGYNDLGYTITTRMRCAGYTEGKIDACQGDSGGPLVCVRNDKWYLMGVVSWGVGCARRGRYGVYADMMDVKYWVQETINKG